MVGPVHAFSAEEVAPNVEVRVREVTGDDEQAMLSQLFPEGHEAMRPFSGRPVEQAADTSVGVRYGRVNEKALEELLEDGVVSVASAGAMLIPSGEARTSYLLEEVGLLLFQKEVY